MYAMLVGTQERIYGTGKQRVVKLVPSTVLDGQEKLLEEEISKRRPKGTSQNW